MFSSSQMPNYAGNSMSRNASDWMLNNSALLPLENSVLLSATKGVILLYFAKTLVVFKNWICGESGKHCKWISRFNEMAFTSVSAESFHLWHTFISVGKSIFHSRDDSHCTCRGFDVFISIWNCSW